MKTFAQEAKAIMKRYKGYESDPLAKEAMDQALSELANKQEAFKQAREEASNEAMSKVDTDLLKYGGCIRKAEGGEIEVNPNFRNQFNKGAEALGVSKADFKNLLAQNNEAFQAATISRADYLESATYSMGGKIKYNTGGWNPPKEDRTSLPYNAFGPNPFSAVTMGYDIDAVLEAMERAEDIPTTMQTKNNAFVSTPGTFIDTRTPGQSNINITPTGSTFSDEPSKMTRKASTLPLEAKPAKDRSLATTKKITPAEEPLDPNDPNLRREANKAFLSDPSNYLGLTGLAADAYLFAESMKAPKLDLQDLQLGRANFGEEKALATAKANQVANAARRSIEENAQTAGQLISGVAATTGEAAESAGKLRAEIQMKEKLENLRRSDLEAQSYTQNRNQEELWNQQMEQEYLMRRINAVAGATDKIGKFGSDKSAAVQQYIDRALLDQNLAKNLPFYDSLFSSIYANQKSK